MSGKRNEWLRGSRCDREQVKSVVRWVSAADLVAERASSGQCSVNARKLLDLVNERQASRWTVVFRERNEVLARKQIAIWENSRRNEPRELMRQRTGASAMGSGRAGLRVALSESRDHYFPL
ncbi:Uncharacterized protein HZ326_17793 [Fusarium oxysporum f. sp. albedinis]|nr:Uncharacterized protein HZ326_17793 [Fusarium oxysporum f. sp. albedinis]